MGINWNYCQSAIRYLSKVLCFNLVWFKIPKVTYLKYLFRYTLHTSHWTKEYEYSLPRSHEQNKCMFDYIIMLDRYIDTFLLPLQQLDKDYYYEIEIKIYNDFKQVIFYIIIAPIATMCFSFFICTSSQQIHFCTFFFKLNLANWKQKKKKKKKKKKKVLLIS